MNNPSHDHLFQSMLETERKTLYRKQFVSQEHIDGPQYRSIGQLRTHTEASMHGLRMRLEAYIYAHEHGEQVIEESILVHATWWDALKDHFMHAWSGLRWSWVNVKLKRITVTLRVNVWQLYPDLTPRPDRPPFIEIMERKTTCRYE